MAGFGHSALAQLGRGLRPYLNPVEEEAQKKSSSKWTKPTWQRENEQRAAMLATEAKRRKADISIQRSDVNQAGIDRTAELRELMESGRANQTDEGTVKGLRALHSNATGQLNPDIARVGRGTQHADMPLSQQDRQASEIAYRDAMGEKPADILTKAFGNGMQVDYEEDKRKFAGQLMQESTDIANTEKAQLALQEKKNVIARSLKDWEYKEAKRVSDEEAAITKAALKQEEKLAKAQASVEANEAKENIRITALQRKISLENLKLSRDREEARKKTARDLEVRLKSDELKAIGRENSAMASLNKRNSSWRKLSVAQQNQLKRSVFGDTGSLRAGFDTQERMDPDSPTTRAAPRKTLQWPATSNTLSGFLKSKLGDYGVGSLAETIPMEERDKMTEPVSDQDWTSMVGPQERSVIMDQMWRTAVSQANSKGTNAQEEFSLLNLLISEGKVSPYDFADGVSPDITVQDESTLLAKLQSGDPLGNAIYNIPGAGQFQWDQNTQKFVQVQ
jgi:hypothetical protein